MKIYCYNQSDIDNYAGRDIWVKARFENGIYWIKILSVSGDTCVMSRISAAYDNYGAKSLGAMANQAHEYPKQSFNIVLPAETMSTEELMNRFLGE